MATRKSHDDGGDAATFLISVAAELAGMHAQTLRTYDRLGLVSPRRTSGGGRRYSSRDVEMLREVQRLSQDEGVNLAGVKRIIELTDQVDALRSRLAEMQNELDNARRNIRPGTELVPVPRTNALVVWQPRKRKN
ncbi:heat shock protein transcriptional repressor HspR [Gordonia malaquae]|uniref:heat shock protein transcriptional repressor HspR n=1 Tax=Gordonia malaquae TaxID=410332 RepID=UPI00301ACEB9